MSGSDEAETDRHVGHHHHSVGGWSALQTAPLFRWVAVAVGVAALATVVGVASVWPDGSGQRAAIENARELGLATERLSASVLSVSDGPCSYGTSEDPQNCRTVVLELGDGEPVALPEWNLSFVQAVPDLSPGENVVVGYEAATDTFFYADRDRTTPIIVLALLFAVVVIALGRWRGVAALTAMTVTLVVLVAFVAPSVLDGHHPVLVAVVAASLIAFVSLYLTHGVNPTTTVALAGTLGALGLTLVLSGMFFSLSKFSGVATEEALTLPFLANVDLSALLLGGAVLGALGALDDVTVTQVSAVAELRRRNLELTSRELFASGIRVGRDHIASTVNTLLLAYAGASTPLLLLFAVSDQSAGSVANSEVVALEIVRVLCGSIGLVAAVPLTTALAVAVLPPSEAASETSRQSSWDDFSPVDNW